MGKHADSNDFNSMSGELPQGGEKKEQLGPKKDPLDPGMGEVSTSPIETF